MPYRTINFLSIEHRRTTRDKFILGRQISETRDVFIKWTGGLTVGAVRVKTTEQTTALLVVALLLYASPASASGVINVTTSVC
jgi:hypothetical protein